MNCAKAISDNKTSDMYVTLSAIHRRYGIMFLIGINTGLRISDILSLCARHFKTPELSVVEKKTGKRRTISLRPFVYDEVCRHISSSGLRPNDYIVFSRPDRRSKPLSRSQAHRVIVKASKRLGLQNTSCHSMRKTYARNLYELTGSVEEVRRALNHKSAATTMLYIFGSFEAIAERVN